MAKNVGHNDKHGGRLYTGAIHGFPQPSGGIAYGVSTGIAFDQDGGAESIIVVLGGSLSLVALVFAFITYSSIKRYSRYLWEGLMDWLNRLVTTIQTTLLSWYCRGSFRCVADTWSVNRFEAASFRNLGRWWRWLSLSSSG
ncbi:uncharacterized protein LOC118648336 [Monomorium pharaonis]|uniref:uncharacterized protein LOC118648336 n=1 Tax=Monomorium pharaonis TaxID=307658 RepID=UPI0017467D93|nr:uncharacterized protein LOC118648336 [Monomorium pharaonis]